MDELNAKLANLSPEARARVEEVLRTNIDAELAAVKDPAALKGQFSRGIIFSRVTSAAREETLINEALTMDDTKFSAFAERLSKLKNIKEIK